MPQVTCAKLPAPPRHLQAAASQPHATGRPQRNHCSSTRIPSPPHHHHQQQQQHAHPFPTAAAAAPSPASLPSSNSGSGSLLTANLDPASSLSRCFWKRSSAFSSAVRLSSSSAADGMDLRQTL